MLAIIDRLARWTAIIGGVCLTLLILLACVSILGRSVNTLAYLDGVNAAVPAFAQLVDALKIGSVSGDFEIIEIGIAFTIFSFLPLCQLHGGHATVDIFTAALPKKVNLLLITLWEVALSVVILLICWRLFEGMMGKMRSHETTMLLQLPMWWAYGLSFASSLVSVIVSLYCMVARIIELFTGRHLMPKIEGAVH